MTVTRVELDVPSAPGGRTNAYLVGDDPALLVDPAVRSPGLDEAVAARSVGAIAVTHAHPDHVDAVAEYADRTGATVWAHAGHADRFADATGRDPDRRFREGTTIPTGTAPVSVVEAPGHTPDHVAFETPVGTLVGDCAVAEGSVAVAAPEGDLRAYLTTLRRLHARSPRRLYPGHGSVVDDPRATLERLLSHRLDRERRVLAAVDDGARTIDTALDAAYDKDVSAVYDLAYGTVLAHVEKLAVEGKVEWDGSRVRPAR